MRRSVGLALFVLLLTQVAVASPARASVLIAPARIEVEVGQAGASQPLTIFNRGHGPVWARAYAGGAIQQPDGSIRYLDDERARASAEAFVMVDRNPLSIAPGSAVSVPVQFGPLGERASYYPVIFVELFSSETEADAAANGTHAGGPVAMLTRVAIPILMTNALTLPEERQFSPALLDLAVRPEPDENALEFSVRVRNDGNVHGEVKGEIALFEPSGRQLATLPFQSVRILPGAIRDVTVRWPLPDEPGEAMIIAALSQHGAAPHAFDPAARSRQISVRWLRVGDAFRVSVEPSPAPAIQSSAATAGAVDVALESSGR